MSGGDDKNRERRRKTLVTVVLIIVLALIGTQALLLKRISNMAEELGLIRGEMARMDRTVSNALGSTQDRKHLEVEDAQFVGQYGIDGRKLKIEGTIRGTIYRVEKTDEEPIAIYLSTENSGEPIDYVKAMPDKTDQGWEYSFAYRESFGCTEGDNVVVNVVVVDSEGNEYGSTALKLCVGADGELTEEEPDGKEG